MNHVIADPLSAIQTLAGEVQILHESNQLTANAIKAIGDLISEYEKNQATLKAEIADVRELQKQILRSSSGLSIPPAHLQKRVVGSVYESFVTDGSQDILELSSILGRFGRKLLTCPSILDFGCGCGRVIRAFKNVLHGNQKLWGCLPSFYRTAIHTKQYVLEKWNRNFEILDICEFACNPQHWCVVLRNIKPA